MEITPALIISILSIIFVIVNYVVARKDKAVNDGKEAGANQRLIEYRLDELTNKVNQILNKLESYDKEIESKVAKAMDIHIKEFHRNTTKRSTK